MDRLLEGDFDPDEYDRQMAAAFDDGYYDIEEEEAALFGRDAEIDDLMGEGSSEEEAAPAGFKELHQKLKAKATTAQSESEEDYDQQQVRLACIDACITPLLLACRYRPRQRTFLTLRAAAKA